MSCPYGGVGFTNLCFEGVFLAESFTLDLYTDFDLGPPTLDDGTHGV